MFEELIKINRNGYGGKKNRSFPDILESIVRSVHLLYRPVLIFSLCSFITGLTLSYFTLLLDFYKSLLGKWIISYVIFLLLTPSVFLFIFCRQLARLIKIGKKFIRDERYDFLKNLPRAINPRRLFGAFKNVNRQMIHFKGNLKGLSDLKLMELPLFYYLVIVSFSLSIAYFVVLFFVGFGWGVWYFFRP